MEREKGRVDIVVSDVIMPEMDGARRRFQVRRSEDEDYDLSRRSAGDGACSRISYPSGRGQRARDWSLLFCSTITVRCISPPDRVSTSALTRTSEWLRLAICSRDPCARAIALATIWCRCPAAPSGWSPGGVPRIPNAPLQRRDCRLRVCLARSSGWLSETHEEDTPQVEHYSPLALPVVEGDRVEFRVIAGEFAGVRSPVGVLSPTLWRTCRITGRRAVSALNGAVEHEERGVYLISGDVDIDGTPLMPERMVLLAPGQDAVVVARSTSPAQILLLGGTSLGPRHMWKTALARTPERLEQAKTDWADGRIASVVGENERGNFPG